MSEARPILEHSGIESSRVNLNFLTDSRGDISLTGTRTSKTKQLNGSTDKNTPQPIFYLDTNIMMDASKSRNKNSMSLISTIDKNNWECITSAFAFMEMLDIEQDREFVQTGPRDVDYNTICRNRHCREMTLPGLQNAESAFFNFYQQYPFIHPVLLNAQGWDLALHITSYSNIFAPDAIHLATAWMYGCHLLITNDSHLIKESKKILDCENISCFDVCRAEECESTLQEMGIEVIENDI